MWIENPQLGCTGSQILRNAYPQLGSTDPAQQGGLKIHSSLAQDHRSCAAGTSDKQTPTPVHSSFLIRILLITFDFPN
jgi:hypothetical protein